MNALDELEEIKELVNDNKKFKYKNIVNFNCDCIKDELEYADKCHSLEEQLGCPLEVMVKALEIIKKKPQAELSLIQLGKIKTYEEYLNYTSAWELDLYGDMVYTEEEFDTLKGILNDEQ